MEELSTLKLLADPLRLRILFLLKDNALTVSDLTLILQHSQSNISHHVKLLRETKVILPEKSSRLNVYKINPDFIKQNTIGEVLFPHLHKLIGDQQIQEDENRLKQVLLRRKGNGKDWEKWRKSQPDEPYTYEFAFYGIHTEQIALDLGCGRGDFLEMIQPHFKHVVGIDLLPTLTSKMPILQANALRLPFQSSVFDVIYSRISFGFFDSILMALTEVVRVLKPEGILSVIDSPQVCEKIKKCSKTFHLTIAKEKQYPAIHLLSFQKGNANEKVD